MMSYQPLDFVIVRTPFYPFNNLFEIDIRSLLNDPYFKEALFLSSPILVDEIEKYLSGNLNEKEEEKLLLTVYRFYLRAAYRCTPFGLFAGISIGKWADETKMELCSQNLYKKNIRLDTHFLSSIVHKTLTNPAIKNHIKWFSNNTVYPIHDKLHYLEYRVNSNSRTHHLTKVTNSAYVQLVLNKAQSGATISEIIELLVSDEISYEDAASFIEELIEGSLLTPAIEPKVTGKEYHNQIIEELRLSPEIDSAVKILLSIIDQLRNTNNQKIGSSVTQLKKILQETKEVIPDLDPTKLFQCDMYKPTNNCTINKLVTDELSKAIKLLNSITPFVESSNLKEFKEKFVKRYETQEVPLLEVLDNEAGIGYPVSSYASADNVPLLNNFFVRDEDENNHINHHQQNSRWSRFLRSKFQDAMSQKAYEIEITEAEVQTIFKDQKENEQLPADSLYTLGSILAKSSEDIDKGNFLVLHEVTAGPSAINLLGRFCHMSDELTVLAKKTLKEEEQARPDCIFAEILHISQARLGNILMRPVLRDYEVPILTQACVDKEYTILLSDLLVSVKNGRILLRSKRLNKEVIPRLTTAHNFSMNPVPHYQFLCDLQFQGIKGGLSWSWGILNEFSFLPRVRFGKTILTKARWILVLSDLTTKKNILDPELFELVRAHFAKNHIPEIVTITQGDNQLPVDIRNLNCLKILIQDLKKFKSLVLQECLFNTNNLVINGYEGGFTNEIIIPWQKRFEVKPNQYLRDNFESIKKEFPEQQRVYLPGSEWHYTKIYCGVKTADAILVEVIKPLVEALLQEGVVSKFFFIRYYDPDHHLRIRFRGEENFYAEITNRLNKELTPLIKADLISNVQTEIYKREIERYGFENIDNSESLFFADSVATLNILSLLEGDEGDNLRWQFAIKGVNDLLDAFKFTKAMKVNLMNWLSSSFAKEFNADGKESKKQLSAKYREHRQAIEMALTEFLNEDEEFYPVWEFFKIRKSALDSCASEFFNLSKTQNLSVDLNDLLASYIHMFLNRFLRSKQRMQEMIIYDLLHQHYKSQLVRESKNISFNKIEKSP